MAEFYIDPEGGNDANNGTTFALRRKSIAGLTGHTAGDTIKIMASRDPGLLGNCQWTDNSNAIAIPAGLVQPIDDITSTTGWVASANVTLSAATQWRLPPASLQVTPGSAFTTGKAAYKTLAAPLDLSAFQVISVQVMMNTAAANGFWQLRLCSDTLGDVPVVTIPVTLRQNGTFVSFSITTFFPLEFDNGAPLPSNINSISLYCPVDPGTGYIRLNNLIASKGYDDPLHLSLASIIGKNTAQEPEWYPIRYITATQVWLGNYAFTAGLEGRPYSGVTENVPTYARLPCLYPWSSAERPLPSGSGTAANYVKISGGWNRVDMSTQTGDTFWSGLGGTFGAMIDQNLRNYIEYSRLCPVAFTDTILFSNPNGTRVYFPHVVGCFGLVPAVTSHKGPLEYYIGYVTNPQTQVCADSTNGPPDFRLSIKRLTGGSNNGLAGMRWNCGERMLPKYDIGRIDNFGINGLYGQIGHYVLKGTKFDRNNQTDVMVGGNCRIEIDNGEFLSATPFNVSNMPLSELRLSNIGGDPTKHSTYIGNGASFHSNTTVLDTGSTMSWKMSLGITAYTSWAPLAVPLMTFAVKANKLVTVTARIRRPDTDCGAGIRVEASPFYGIATEQVAWASGPANAFETVTLTFTPTKPGVITVDALGWQNLTSPDIYFDNFTVSQAD